MTDHKYTDEEVIKALEHCANSNTTEPYCNGCPYETTVYCASALSIDTLDLIKRQMAEIERLQKYNTDVAFRHYNDGIKEFADKLKEELTTGAAVMRVSVLNIIDSLIEEMTEQKNNEHKDKIELQ